MLANHVSAGDMGLSVDNDQYGLVLLDVCTDVCDILAARFKSAPCTLAAIKEFGSAAAWQFFGSENATELKAAAVTTWACKPFGPACVT